MTLKLAEPCGQGCKLALTRQTCLEFVMADSNPSRIEIFAPFGEAFELTKKILFQPFDLSKWLVIGFAAWLATFFSGGGFNYGWRDKDWNWSWRSEHAGLPFSWHGAPPWLVPVGIVVLCLALAFVVLILWLNARGRLNFSDFIERNPGAIVEPWREYRSEGNRFFVLQLVISFCSLIVFGGLGLLFFLYVYWHQAVAPVAIVILFGVSLLLVALLIALIMKFVVPVMYRQRCDALSAFRQVWGLIVARPGVFVLFGLFYIVLCVAAAMIGFIAACATCCIAALPYVGTVILLPIVMFLYAYPLCFLRQFGDSYDVWAAVKPAELPSAPPPEPPAMPQVPPIQQPPPTA
jgi:hypothetical protein